MLTALLALALAAPPPPKPDPPPGHKAPVHLVSYDFWAHAVDPQTHKVIPGLWYHCHVPARWHGKPNWAGHKRCVLRQR